MTEDEKVIEHLRSCDKHPERASMYTFDNAIECIKQLRKERDEARDVMHSVVEEFVQHGQPMNRFYPPTPIHECEFRYNPESGKCDACDACEAWSDYVRICHPLEDTEEEEAP